MVIITVLTLEWVMEEREHQPLFVYLLFVWPNGMAVRLVCVGRCGDGLEEARFTCGGCGEQTAQGGDDGTAPRSVSCGGAVRALPRFGERRRQQAFCTCSRHLWSGAWVWTVWICEWFTWASERCWEVGSLLMFPMLIFPWCPCDLALKSIDISLATAGVRMRLLSFGSLHVNQQILLQSHPTDWLLVRRKSSKDWVRRHQAWNSHPSVVVHDNHATQLWRPTRLLQHRLGKTSLSFGVSTSTRLTLCDTTMGTHQLGSLLSPTPLCQHKGIQDTLNSTSVMVLALYFPQ